MKPKSVQQDVVVARSNFIASSRHGSAHDTTRLLYPMFRAVTDSSERSGLRTLAGSRLRRKLHVVCRLIPGCVWPSTHTDVVVLVRRHTSDVRWLLQLEPGQTQRRADETYIALCPTIVLNAANNGNLSLPISAAPREDNPRRSFAVRYSHPRAFRLIYNGSSASVSSDVEARSALHWPQQLSEARRRWSAGAADIGTPWCRTVVLGLGGPGSGQVLGTQRWQRSLTQLAQVWY